LFERSLARRRYWKRIRVIYEKNPERKKEDERQAKMRGMDEAATDSKYLISYFDKYTKKAGLVVPFKEQ